MKKKIELKIQTFVTKEEKLGMIFEEYSLLVLVLYRYKVGLSRVAWRVSKAGNTLFQSKF